MWPLQEASLLPQAPGDLAGRLLLGLSGQSEEMRELEVHVLSFSLLGVSRQAKGGSREGLEPATGTKCPGRFRSGAARCPVVLAPLPNPPAVCGGCSQGETGWSSCSNASLRSCRLFSYLCQLQWPGHKTQRPVGGVTPGGMASNPQSHIGSRGGLGG